VTEAAQRTGRSPEAIRLVAITKGVGTDEIRILSDLGLSEFGENRVEEARSKIGCMDRVVRWHMVGLVQRRKARDVVALFDAVDSVDRLELAMALDQQCEQAGKSLDIMVEVNLSNEPSKHGFRPESLPEAVQRMKELPHLQVRGLMTMAPFTQDPQEVRPVFATLRELGRQLGLEELSMGMSNDFEVAIEEGATQVRIGSALFS
jgi:pyridoxal phosphate enzyme (YggS family)